MPPPSSPARATTGAGRFRWWRGLRFLALRADRATSPYIREKFTRESSTARGAVREYFARFPKERYQTELEIWRYLPSQTIEFVMKRLREPIEDGG
jgi:hypothetical protein